MMGFLRKKFVTVIMDGSDKIVVGNIISIIEMMTTRRDCKVKSYPLDNDHPTMIAVETITSSKTYAQLQETIESYYPNLCTFDVKV